MKGSPLPGALPHKLGRYRGKADIAFVASCRWGLWVRGLDVDQFGQIVDSDESFGEVFVVEIDTARDHHANAGTRCGKKAVAGILEGNAVRPWKRQLRQHIEVD